MARDLSQGREAPTDAEIHPLIAHRWSPRALSERPVEPEKLRRIMEAARWAPSSFNEQPWRFLLATRDEPEWLERLQGYLYEGNDWALRAPVLIASAYKTHFTRNDKPNVVAMRDLGAAEENMFLQSYAEGLVMHQMAGFDRARLKDELLPDGFEPGAMTAIGYRADPNELDEKQSERGPRKRKPLAEIVFGERWGEGAAVL